MGVYWNLNTPCCFLHSDPSYTCISYHIILPRRGDLSDQFGKVSLPVREVHRLNKFCQTPVISCKKGCFIWFTFRSIALYLANKKEQMLNWNMLAWFRNWRKLTPTNSETLPFWSPWFQIYHVVFSTHSPGNISTHYLLHHSSSTPKMLQRRRNVQQYEKVKQRTVRSETD